MSAPGSRVLTHIPLQLLARVTQEFPDIELALVPMQGTPAPELRGEVLDGSAQGQQALGALN